MWIILVWVVSTCCYLPLYFEKLGYTVPNVLIQMKYLFVIVPLIFSLVCVKRRTSIKKWLGNLFVKKIEFEAWAVCGVIALCGILCTSILNRAAWNGVSLLFSAFYLFLMATLEEIAWRGFRLESMLKKTEKGAILVVSLEWAIWHIPMWMIRNSLGLNEIPFWLVYTVFIGNILGRCMIWYKNILVPIVLHTIFNLCFLMPIKINVWIVFGVLAGVLILGRIKEKKTNMEDSDERGSNLFGC